MDNLKSHLVIGCHAWEARFITLSSLDFLILSKESSESEKDKSGAKLESDSIAVC